MLKLKELRQGRNITQNKLAERLGLSRSTIAMYETGGSEPDLETLKAIASFFNVSVDYLMGREQKVDNNVRGMQMERSVVKVPVYGTIPAGVPIEMIEDSYIEDEEEIPSDWLKGGNTYFCLKVKGKSMMPKFEDGDTLILKQQDDCESGDYCAVSINHSECTFKKVIKRLDGITLQPLNPDFAPMVYSNKEIAELPITILGVVKEVRRSY